MPYVDVLRCIRCSRAYKQSEVRYTCLECGPIGLLDIVYHYDNPQLKEMLEELKGNRDRTIGRYLAILPLERAFWQMPVNVGGTPMYQAPRLAQELGLKHLWIKDDGRNATGSFKDRASAVCVARAIELGETLITAASTGNAASSLAGIAAAARLQTVIFVPRTAPQAKIAQLLIYGARVLMVDGTYDNAFDLCLEATARYGWYSRNTGFNPYLLEGKKTVSLEIAEDMGWNPPDRVFVSMGDGCIMGGVWKGFHDLQQLGMTRTMPRLMGVQAEGSDALTRAMESGGDAQPQEAHTVADSISVGTPRAASQALRAMRQSQGGAVRVTDAEILEAMRILARTTGVFAEPAGAAATAGLIRMARSGQLDPAERIVVINTGNGLKDTAGAMQAVDVPPLSLAPTVEALEATVRQFIQ